jgi:hypothetical protein
MKNIRILLLMTLLISSLTSCYKENDVVDDLWQSVGKVPNISVWGVGAAAGYTTSTSITVAPGANVNLYLQYFAPEGITVKEIRISQRLELPAGTPAGTPLNPITLATTLPGSTGQFDQQARQLVLNTPLVAFTIRNRTITYFIDAIGSNDLVSTRRSVTVRSTP